MKQPIRTLALSLVLAVAPPPPHAGEAAKEADADRGRAAELITHADALTKERDYEPALELYRQAGELDPQASMAFRGAGYVLVLMDRHEEAIPFLKDAIRIDPAASRPWENLGLAYSAIYDRVEGERRQLVAKAPGGRLDGNPMWERTKVLAAKLAERDWRGDALTAFREAVRLEPSEPKYWYNLGTSLSRYRPDQPNDAIDALLRALDLDDSYYPALRNVALALQRQNRRREARDVCMRMEKVVGPDDPAIVSILGDLAYADGDTQEAEKRFTKLLELDPASTHAHMWLAIIYRQRGDLERSHEHTEKAVALDPANAKAIRWDIERDH